VAVLAGSPEAPDRREADPLLAGSSQVLGSLEGTVRMESGEPAAFSRVIARCLSTEGPYLRGAWTDREGRYYLNDLPLGSYVVDYVYGDWPALAEASASESIPPPPSGAGAFGRCMQSAERRLVEGHPNRVEVTAGRATECHIRLPKLAAVEFRVVKDDGSALRGRTRLERVSEHGALLRQPELSPERARAIGEDGRVAFPPLPNGWYVPVVCAGGWEFECGPCEVRGERTVTLPLRFGPCHLNVRVLDPKGDPLYGATLKLIGSERCQSVTQSDEMGSQSLKWESEFEVPYLQEGTYDLTVEAGSAVVRVPGISLVRDVPFPTLEVLMPPVGTVRARVVNPSGDPVDVRSWEFIFIAVREEDGHRSYGTADGSRSVWPMLHETGLVAFERLIGGSYRIGRKDVFGEGLFLGAPAAVEVKPHETTEVTVVIPESDR